MSTKTHVTKQEESETEKTIQIRSSDPGSPTNGQTWVNTTTKEMKSRIAGVSEVIQAAVNRGQDPSSGYTNATYSDTSRHTLCSVTLTCTGRPVLLMLIGWWYSSGVGQIVSGFVKQDSSDIIDNNITVQTSGYRVSYCLPCVVVPTAGSHTFKGEFQLQSGGSTTVYGQLIAIEL